MVVVVPVMPLLLLLPCRTILQHCIHQQCCSWQADVCMRQLTHRPAAA
jgi:hypothetical protein